MRPSYCPRAGAEGIFVNSNTGEVWVTDTGGSVRKYPRYDQLIFNPAATVTIPSNSPIAVTQDQYGDLIVAEAFNRVTFYYPALSALNAASFQKDKPLAPNTIATIFPGGIQFGKDTANAFDRPNPLPLPTDQLADIQVTVNGTPAPLYYVGPTQINFVVPWNAPTTGTADVQVIKVSTGQLLAASPIPMNTVSPAIFVDYLGRQRRQTGGRDQSGRHGQRRHPSRQARRLYLDLCHRPRPGIQPARRRRYPPQRPGLLPGSPARLYRQPTLPIRFRSRARNSGTPTATSTSSLSPAFRPISPECGRSTCESPWRLPRDRPPLGLLFNSFPDNTPAVTGYRIVFYVAQ